MRNGRPYTCPNIKAFVRNKITETSLVAQWLRLCASTAGVMGSIPGGGTKIPHAVSHSQNTKSTHTQRSSLLNLLKTLIQQLFITPSHVRYWPRWWWGCCFLVSKSCLTLGNPMDCSPPGASVCGVSQARILEWVAMPSSRGSS